ncbi:MAG: hypothetical protein WCG80_17320 [Spirochaetales bacterium]
MRPGLWFRINTWAFVLGGSALAAAVVSVVVWPFWPGSAVFAVTGLTLAYHSARIAAEFPRKVRAYAVLRARNARNYQSASFAPFMVSPCGRIVVRIVLEELGHEADFRQLRVENPVLVFKKTQTIVRYRS